MAKGSGAVGDAAHSLPSVDTVKNVEYYGMTHSIMTVNSQKTASFSVSFWRQLDTADSTNDFKLV